ncbi:DUF5994 family protein [Kitasatospora sp. NPDC088391]|uniref:DUF5994 family protein n=1 Tax=Kitasatospora sp. NPDC088391 TaxID=3364074 RepID=UPI003818F5CA
MNAIADRTEPAVPGRPLRLLLAPERRKPGRLDGAWWPRSNDLLRELPSLAAKLDARWGRVTRITVNPAQWPVIPRRIPVTGHVVHAGWYAAEQDKHMVMLRSYGRRLDLLVVPPQTDAVDADRLMAEASDPRNTRTASELLMLEPVRREGPRPRPGRAAATARFDGTRGAGRRVTPPRQRAAYWTAGR